MFLTPHYDVYYHLYCSCHGAVGSVGPVWYDMFAVKTE